MAQQRSNFASASPAVEDRWQQQAVRAAPVASLFCGFCMWFVRLGQSGWFWGELVAMMLTGFFGFRPNGRLRRRRWRQTACWSYYVRTAVHRQRFSSFCWGFLDAAFELICQLPHKPSHALRTAGAYPRYLAITIFIDSWFSYQADKLLPW